MDKIKILDLRNDGLNIAADGQYLYIRCMKTIYKYDLDEMSLAACNEVFKKDGKSRGFSIYSDYVFLHDFLDFYILDKDSLRVMDKIRLGEDLSSDIGGVITFDDPKVYVGIRNGRIDVLDINTKASKRFTVSDSSFWGSRAAGKYIYAGTVKGELIEIEKETLEVTRKTVLGKKNIYSVYYHNDCIYTVSLDKSIKIIDAETFKIVREAKKAVDGMEVKILGIYNDCLVVAFRSKVSLWDINTLQNRGIFDFPTGRWNNGALLCGGRLLGSDDESVYSSRLG